ncbi:MAG: helix-turn-helix domain-containing protein [Lachnospiraceae bacterium]|nr:helix-turn-helix domain-containing protein [Lachnospiraceae bacterium]
MTLGEKIFKLRSERGLSQEAFGESLGVSRQSVSKWETDQSVPELEKIVGISELFGVSTDYLLKDSVKNPYMEDFSHANLYSRPNSQVEQEWRINREEAHRDGIEKDGVGNAESAASYTAGQTAAGYLHYRNRAGLRYEYKSKKAIKGLPLVHVNIGFGACRAKGIFAVGNLASGIFSIGLLSAGVFSVGILSAGLFFALGTVAVGLISVGSLAIGCIAFGAITLGIFCMGALNFGEFCVGALSYGKQIAIGDEAHGRIAIGFSHAVGEIYEEVSKSHEFDYPVIERIIDENISSEWFPFREWMKGIIRGMSSGAK